MEWGRNGRKGEEDQEEEKETTGTLLTLAPPGLRLCVSADHTVSTTASIQVGVEAVLNNKQQGVRHGNSLLTLSHPSPSSKSSVGIKSSLHRGLRIRETQ